MKYRSVLFVAVLIAMVASTVVTPGCSLLAPGDTLSSQVLAEVRSAETALLTGLTIVNIRYADGKISEERYEAITAAADILMAIITEARDAAKAGDVVTVDQKLDLFNKALRDFNEQYIAAQ